MPEEKSLKTLPENRERRCLGEMCRETVPEIGDGDQYNAKHSVVSSSIFQL